MSKKDDENSKNKQPDYYLQLAQEGRHGKERITDVGVLWEGKNGYLTGETIAGRVIAQPRAARDELNRMRAENAKKQEQSVEQEHNQEP